MISMLITVWLCLAAASAAAAQRPIDLRVNSLTSHVGIDSPTPTLSWKWSSCGQLQTDCRGLQVTSCALEILGNGGLLGPCNGYQVVYAGVTLQSLTTYSWRVKANQSDSEWSDWANFTTGILPGDSALVPQHWIGVPFHEKKNLHQFRTEFQVSGKVQRAHWVISGVGVYKAWVNGKPMGNNVTFFSQTVQYDKRVLYDVFDVTDLLVQQNNTLAVSIGSWWYNTNSSYFYNPPFQLPFGEKGFTATLVLQYTEGGNLTVTTASGWRQQQGHVVSDDMFKGEVHDANLATPGWTSSGFDDSTWVDAYTVTPPIGASQMFMNRGMPLIKPSSLVSPMHVVALNHSSVVFDFGSNAAGICRFQFGNTLAKRQMVRFVHGEQRVPNGDVIQSPATPNRRVGNGARIIEETSYTASGSNDVFEPNFVYYGFRYVQVTSQGALTLDASSVSCQRMHTALESENSFRVGEGAPQPGRNASHATVINAIQDALRRTALSNYFGVPTDCPTREKRGWTGDMSAAHETMLFNFDMQSTYKKWLIDLQQAQSWHNGPEGCVPEIVPSFMNPTNARFSDPAWGSGLTFVLDAYARWFDDADFVKTMFPSAMAYLNHIEAYAMPLPSPYRKVTMLQGKYQGSRYGDWCAFYDSKTASAHVSSLINGYLHIKVVRATLNIARALKLDSNITDPLAARQLQLENAFAAIFFSNATGFTDPLWPAKTAIGWTNGQLAVQTAQGLGINLDILPPANQAIAARKLVDDVAQNWHSHPTTGVVGTVRLLQALTNTGSFDVAFETVTQQDQPSWGYMALTEGSLWENWDGSGSWNHIMLGSIGAWFYSHLAGIQPPEGYFGTWKNMTIHPHLTPLLGNVTAQVESPTGLVKVFWENVACDGQSSGWDLLLTVPLLTSANVVFDPSFCSSLNATSLSISESGTVVFASGHYVAGTAGVEDGHIDTNGHIVLKTSSGTFSFSVFV